MNDENGKKSWSEIDQMRIRGQKVERKVSKGEVREQKQATTQAKKELESLFSGSKISKEKREWKDRIQALRGKPDYYQEMTRYLETYGVPLEFEIQMLFLDHRDTKIVLDVLEELKRQAPKMDLGKQSLLAQKLKVMAVSTFDATLAAKIVELEGMMLRT